MARLVGRPRNRSRGLFLIDLKKRLDTMTPDHIKTSSVTSSDVSTHLRSG